MTAAWIVATHVLPSGVTCVASEEEAERVVKELVDMKRVREAVCYRVEVDERHVEGALAGEQGETGSGCRGAGERLSGAEEGEVA
mgnify:FL=1